MRPIARVTADLLTIAGYAGWALGVIFFANGLTSPAASARVAVDGAAPAIATGWMTGVSTAGVFHYEEIYRVSDRLGTRLALIAIWGTVGAFCVAAGRLLRAYGLHGTPGLLGAVNAWRLLAAASASAGVVVPFAQWAQAAAVLTVAGQPVGLSPVANVGYSWLVLAGVIILLQRTVLQSRRFP